MAPPGSYVVGCSLLPQSSLLLANARIAMTAWLLYTALLPNPLWSRYAVMLFKTAYEQIMARIYLSF